MSKSVESLSVKYNVSIEGAEESTKQLESVQESIRKTQEMSTTITYPVEPERPEKIERAATISYPSVEPKPSIERVPTVSYPSVEPIEKIGRIAGETNKQIRKTGEEIKDLSVEPIGEIRKTVEETNKEIQKTGEAIEDLSTEPLEDIEEVAKKTSEEIVKTKKSMETSDIKEFTRDAGMLLGTIASVDYAFMSWSRVAKDFNIRSFIRTLLSTIMLIRRLTMLIEIATAKQHALNAAQTAGAVSATTSAVGAAGTVGAAGATGAAAGLTSLLGPIGLIATVGLATYSVVQGIMDQNAKITEEMRKDRENREMRERVFERVFGESESNEEYERKRREAYRGVVPG